LLDAYTITRSRNSQDLAGLRVAIVGDIRHSRVARSNVEAFTALGAEVLLVAPPTLLPPVVSHWPVEVVHDFDSVVDSVDVLYMLRLQAERMNQGLVPSLAEYSTHYGLTPRRVARMSVDAQVMHPGPMNRGVEMVVDPAEIRGSLIHRQVTNGVAVRMAVLFDSLAVEPDHSALREEAR
jgi:aspartate carbamoyltransferase catalytic subunit